jgi:hypothetical protein
MFRRRRLPPIAGDPKLVRRAQQMDMGEIVQWADQSLAELNKYFMAWRTQRHPELLEDAVLCTEAVYTLLDELRNRRPGVPAQKQTRQTKPRVT